MLTAVPLCLTILRSVILPNDVKYPMKHNSLTGLFIFKL